VRNVLPGGACVLLVAAIVQIGGCRAEFRTGSRADSRSSRATAERMAWLESWADVVAADPDPAVVPDARARTWIAGEKLPWLVRDRGLGIEMVLVPAGGFEEVDGDQSNGDRTTRRVEVEHAFYLGRCEVDQEEWARAMVDNPSEFRDDPRMPVDSVAWELLTDGDGGFLHATGFELPTEIEWEWAARGPDGRTYPWGAIPDERDANFIDEEDKTGSYVLRTTQIGHYLGGASWCGALDLAGNVFEWCRAGSSADAPIGALRGGAWFSGSGEVRAAARLTVPAGYANDGFGFRVVRRIPARA